MLAMALHQAHRSAWIAGKPGAYRDMSGSRVVMNGQAA
ncbi:hypothetical protein C4K38_1339 [Pseudomonas chlororaphis subsp. piscium]|nr:hypothetical protein C4K38_1339 [Pseudomonas chlororaphis subsp. piscium]